MHAQNRTVVEVRLIEEADLVAFAAGGLDSETTEAIEAYLLHHPHAADRVEAYRRAVLQTQRKQRRLM
jgi:anti-sigma factor RsiW